MNKYVKFLFVNILKKIGIRVSNSSYSLFVFFLNLTNSIKSTFLLEFHLETSFFFIFFFLKEKDNDYQIEYRIMRISKLNIVNTQ